MPLPRFMALVAAVIVLAGITIWIANAAKMLIVVGAVALIGAVVLKRYG